MIYKYVDPFQNVYWFREDPEHLPTDIYRHYGIILKIRPGFSENIHKQWEVGCSIAVSKSVCAVEEDPNVLKEILCGT